MTATHRLLELASLGLLSSLLIVPALAQMPDKLSGAALAPDAWPGFGLANHAADTIGQALGSAGQAIDSSSGQVRHAPANQPSGNLAQSPSAGTGQTKTAKAEPPWLEEADSPHGAVDATPDMSWQTDGADTAPMPASPDSGARATRGPEESGQIHVTGPPVGHPVGVGAAVKH
jgi:hypothetical protein